MSAHPHAGENLRDLAAAELAAFSQELCGPYEEWRSTLLSFRKSLAGLERLCEAAGAALPAEGSKPDAAVAALIDKLGAAAAAEREALTQHLRAEQQSVVSRLEGQLSGLQSDLQGERDRVKTAADDLRTAEELLKTVEKDLAIASSARAEAESALEDAQVIARDAQQAQREAQHVAKEAQHALKEAQQAQQQAVAALESHRAAARAELEIERAEVAQLKQNLEAEKAARARLIDALQTVQRAAASISPNAEGIGDAHAAAVAKAAVAEASTESPVNRPLKLISSKPSANAELERELTEYLKQLFEQIQSIYWADLKSTEDSATAVDRLTANLRHAHNVFSRRLESAGGGDPKLFDEQLAALLDAQSENSFGRHLAIAAYSYQPGARAEAS